MEICNFFWGFGHGCDIESINDHTIHKCGIEVNHRCSEYNEETNKIRWMLYDTSTDSDGEEINWSAWRDWEPGFRLQ